MRTIYGPHNANDPGSRAFLVSCTAEQLHEEGTRLPGEREKNSNIEFVIVVRVRCLCAKSNEKLVAAVS